jgi:hypothetical protein
MPTPTQQKKLQKKKKKHPTGQKKKIEKDDGLFTTIN